MAKSLLSAVVAIRPDLGQFRKSVKEEVTRAGKEVEDKLTTAGERAGEKAGDAVGDGIADGARRGTAQASRSLATLESRLRSAGSAATKYVTLPMVGLGTAISIFGIKAAASFESAQIAFTTMLGSEQQANAFLEDLRDFATSTPFEFTQLTEMSQRLLAMGFAAEEILPTLSSVGDAVAALGGDPQKLDAVVRALGQIRAKGKASAEEMLQLSEAGVPAWEYLAAALGTTIPQAMQAVTDGSVDARMTLTAVLSGMTRDFDGLMEKQAQTVSGKWSNMIDSITTTLADAFAENEDAIKETLDLIIEMAPTFLNQVVPAINDLIVAALPLVRMAADLLESFNHLPDAVKTSVLAMGLLAGPMLTALSLATKLAGVLGVASGTGAAAGAAGAGAGVGAAASAAAVPVAAGAAALAAGYGIGTLLNNALGISDRLGDFLSPPGLAAGGTVTRSGLTWVGEKGPELLNLPEGSEVRPLDKAGITITGDITIVANNPREFAKELDRLARRGAGTTSARRLP